MVKVLRFIVVGFRLEGFGFGYLGCRLKRFLEFRVEGLGPSKA